MTHTPWVIHEQGFEVWFKGGTSLSKGFGLIDRWVELERAWTDIAPMFWGRRHTLGQAVDAISHFLENLPRSPR